MFLLQAFLTWWKLAFWVHEVWLSTAGFIAYLLETQQFWPFFYLVHIHKQVIAMIINVLFVSTMRVPSSQIAIWCQVKLLSQLFLKLHFQCNIFFLFGSDRACLFHWELLLIVGVVIFWFRAFVFRGFIQVLEQAFIDTEINDVIGQFDVLIRFVIGSFIQSFVIIDGGQVKLERLGLMRTFLQTAFAEFIVVWSFALIFRFWNFRNWQVVDGRGKGLRMASSQPVYDLAFGWKFAIHLVTTGKIL